MDALADMLGVDPSTVRGWEWRGHRPWPRVHARLAEVLGLPTATAAAETTFGQRLRAARLRIGLTQAELAARVGLDPRTIRNAACFGPS